MKRKILTNNLIKERHSELEPVPIHRENPICGISNLECFSGLKWQRLTHSSEIELAIK